MLFPTESIQSEANELCLFQEAGLQSFAPGLASAFLEDIQSEYDVA